MASLPALSGGLSARLTRETELGGGAGTDHLRVPAQPLPS